MESKTMCLKVPEELVGRLRVIAQRNNMGLGTVAKLAITAGIKGVEKALGQIQTGDVESPREEVTA